MKLKSMIILLTFFAITCGGDSDSGFRYAIKVMTPAGIYLLSRPLPAVPVDQETEPTVTTIDLTDADCVLEDGWIVCDDVFEIPLFLPPCGPVCMLEIGGMCIEKIELPPCEAE